MYICTHARTGLLRDDVLRLENVQYVQGLIQSEAAQAALRNAKNWRDEYSGGKSRGELGRNRERDVGRDRDMEFEENSSEEDEVRLGGERAESEIHGSSVNQDGKKTYEDKYSNADDASDGRVTYSRKRSKYENVNVNCKNDEEGKGRTEGGGGGGLGRRVSGGGLRVAVCDVNLGASAAASLLRDFVLPHMVTACECGCDSIDVEKIQKASEGNENKMQLERCLDLESNDNLCCLGSDGDDKDWSTGDGTISATDFATKCSISDTTSQKSNPSDPNTKRTRERECLCGGYVVLTLKLPKGAKNAHARSAADSARTVLTKAGCWDFKIVHLNANSSNERTLLCRFGGKRK